MLAYVAIVHTHVFSLKNSDSQSGQVEACKDKMLAAKLRAVLDTFGSAVNFNC